MTDWDAAFAPTPSPSLSAVEGQDSLPTPKAAASDWDAAFAPPAPEPMSSVEMPPVGEKPGFLERTADNLGEGVSRAYGDYFEGISNANPISGAVHGGGEIVDSIGKVAGDAFDTFAPDVVKKGVKKAGEWLGDTEAVKTGVELAQETKQAYDSWKQENPELGKVTDSTLDYVGDATKIGTLMAPGPKVGVTAKIPGKPSLSRQMTAVNKTALEQTRRGKVLKLLEPPDKRGLGNLDTDKYGNHIYKPHPWEKEVADEIVKIKDFKTSAPNARNHNVLRQEATKLREQLEARIEKAGNPAIDKDALLEKLDNIAENLNDMDGGFSLVGDSATTAKNMLVELRNILAKSDGTALGILQARRQFDTAIRNAYGNIYNSNVEHAKNIANKWIRDTLNNTVNDSVKGVDVLNSLQRQHKLLFASDELLAKAFKERSTVIGRLVHGIEDRLGLKLPTTPLALGATATAGAGLIAGYPAAAAVGGTLVTLMGAYKGAAWLGTAPGRQWIINMVKAIESDPLLMKTLKADRLALLAMLDDEKDKEE